jgi:hypothetical protein
MALLALAIGDGVLQLVIVSWILGSGDEDILTGSQDLDKARSSREMGLLGPLDRR